LICLGVALRAMIVHGGSFLLPNLFPTVDWEFWKKVEFGSVYAIAALFPLYVYDLFPAQAPRKPIWFFVAISGHYVRPWWFCLNIFMEDCWRYAISHC